MSRLFAGWLKGIRRMNEQAGSLLSIRRREALSENWYRLEKVTFDQRREDGSSQTLQREVYWNGPGAAVLPIDRGRNTVLLVRQLRIPAHLIEPASVFLIQAA
jgi:hypothetical protein